MKYLIAVMITCLSLEVFAGDSANNGGGLAEQNFLDVTIQLPQIYRACLGSEACRLSSAEKSLLTTIVTTLPQEFQAADQIQFLEGQSMTYFLVEDHILTARTEPQVGAVIWVNRDVIYKKLPLQEEPIPFSVAQALATLTEQLLQHQKVNNKAQRFYIALVIQHFYEKEYLQRNL